MQMIHCVEELELKRRNSQSECADRKPDEKILNILKILSHDVRGSLVAILATLKLLGGGCYGKMDEGVENELKKLSGRVTRLIGMCEECLDRAFSATADLDMEPEVLDLRKDVIDPVLAEFSSEMKDRHIHIDNRLCSIPVQEIPIRTNKIWLKAVFRNLFKNAIRYGDPGCIIVVGFEDHGSSFQLNVYNSGKPIPERRRDQLFTKFKPTRKNENVSPKGMGLGLYLIKEIVQKHGGDLWYEAREDGSNFVFTLPFG